MLRFKKIDEMFFHQIILFMVIIFWFVSCKNEKTQTKDVNGSGRIFQSLSSDVTNINFLNGVKNSPEFNIFSYRNFYNGGGVAIGDLNNDGLSDIYFTSNMGDNKLYINEGNLKFKDITATAGVADSDKWSTGVSLVDINNDGYLDIYVCNAGYRSDGDTKNTLYINNKDLTFTEKAKEYGLDEDGYTTHAAFFDYDQDGDLDVYILNNSFIPVNTLNYSNARNLRAKDWAVKDFLKGGGDKLLRNDNNKFVDVSEEAGIYGSLIGFGLGVTVGDVDGDLYPDIYVSNDFFERDYLYINQKNGTFKEELEQCISHLSTSSMGADMGDLNNDGCPEIFVTDMLPNDEYRLKTTTTFDNINVHNLKVKNGFYHQYLQNSLQVNDCNGKFDETAFYSGVAGSDWSWGALMFDADQDMHTDIFVCNGIYHDVIDQDFIDFFANDVIQKMALEGKKKQLDSIINRMPSIPIQNVAFRNMGELKFKNSSDDWGLTEKTFSNGAAYGDLDNDGDLDLVINNVNQPALIYQNNSREIFKSNFIGLKLVGDGRNTFAIGAICKVYLKNEILTQQLIPNRGFQSSMDLKLVYGLGQNATVDSIQIIWPDGQKSTLKDIKVNQYHTILKNTATTNVLAQFNIKPIFSTSKIVLPAHKEDDHIDFYYERNTPMMLSKEGPKIANGDINGDGIEDIYFCAAAGYAGKIFLGTKTGYKESIQHIFEKFKDWEDTEAVFFDADGDNDLDLFVGSGGNARPQGSRELQDRLYINDRGNFSIDVRALPPNGYNTSVALPLDFDNDGDLDIFVGSRSFPGEYGISPRSFIYKNNGKGMFTEILGSNRKLSEMGMVTDATWGDMDGDNQDELIIVGEWMTPLVMTYQNHQFKEKEIPALKDLSGFWQSVHLIDLDDDGFKDLILGNSGTNGYLQDEKYLPLKLLIADFDKNGMPEKILSRTVNSKEMPIMMKRDVMDQLAILKKKNLKHVEYANKSIQELLGKEVDEAMTKSVTTTKSYIMYNNGKKGHTLEPFCYQAQLSSINDVLYEDVNADGLGDLVLVGNLYGFQPQFGALDANRGLVLINTKTKRSFVPLQNSKSGLNIRGKARQILKSNNRYIVTRNNDFPFIFEKN